MASILQKLNVVEEEADPHFCFLQVCLHLRHVLSRFAWTQHPHVLQHTNTVHCSATEQCGFRYQGPRLTICSRASTWLSCSSHTTDSIWTLLTTLWSRSILQRESFYYLPIACFSLITLILRVKLKEPKKHTKKQRVKFKKITHSIFCWIKYFILYPWCKKAMAELCSYSSRIFLKIVLQYTEALGKRHALASLWCNN